MADSRKTWATVDEFLHDCLPNYYEERLIESMTPSERGAYMAEKAVRRAFQPKGKTDGR